MRKLLIFSILLMILGSVRSQEVQHKDTIPHKSDTIQHALPVDTTLRIINLNPYFTIHVDSIFQYGMEINRPKEYYYWFLRNAPVGVRIDRTSGQLYFKADKSFFRSGKLKYDEPYRVEIGVQNLFFPADRVDTSFNLLFYSTEINSSKLKPTITQTQYNEEGDSIRFKVQCEAGTFPFEQITLSTNIPISNYTLVKRCDDEFSWMIPYDFIRDNDTAKSKTLLVQFIGSDKFQNKDTATLRFVIRPGINYPQKYAEHKVVADEMAKYIKNLKLTFYVITKNVKTNKNARATFDITGSTTALAGTVLSTASDDPGTQDIGKILPSIGLTMVPVKEAVAPSKVQEQNTAAQVRATIKRLEYVYSEGALVGDRDPDLLAKTKKLRDELKQAQLQLVDLPIVDFDTRYSQEEADKYFNNPKVNKKYKLKVN
ncbi:hypothetical protein [Pollutibacter soli]|uniref:hypothetical protein n=1 Tax=Pollutibacter soli TaxID=3034157 RepID=UPI003013E4E6